MGTVERREREKQQRRNDIINTAEKLFFCNGFENTTMDQVAEDSELSKGTLYLYFKNKDDLFEAINARGTNLLADMFFEALKKGKTGLEKTRSIGEAYREFFQKHHDYFDVMVKCQSKEKKIEPTKEDISEGGRAVKFVAEAVATGIKDGSIRSDLDPMTTAVILWGHSTGILELAYHKKEFLVEYLNVDINRLLQSSMEILLQSLKAK